MKSDLQVLITGCYRSGTSHTTLLIGNHPELATTMYTTSFMSFCFDRYNPINKKSNYLSLLNDVEERIFKRWNKKLNVQKIVDDIGESSKVSYGLLYDYMMADLFLKNGITQAVDRL